MQFTVMGDRLYRAGKPVTFRQTPNKGGRINPQGIVIHETAGHLQPGSSVDWLCNPKARVSAHLVIERDGAVTQLAEFDEATWHAGRSKWNGRSGCNNFMVGIELVGPGALSKKPTTNNCAAWFGTAYDINDFFLEKVSCSTHGTSWWMPFTEQQISVTREICTALANAYDMKPGDIAGHFEVSPGRKVDPHPLYDMDKLRSDVAEAIIAPSPKDEFLLAKGMRGDNVKSAQMRLKDLGYDLGPAGADGIFGSKTRAAVLAWEAEQGRTTDGAIDKKDFDVLTAPEAKTAPVTPAMVEEKAKIDGASTAVDVTGAISLTTLATGAMIPDDGWGLLVGGIDRLSTLVTKVSGLGVKIPATVVLAALAATVVIAIWRWTKIIRGATQ